MTSVVETRVHGVGGANAAQLLDDADPKQVQGDRVAGFFTARRPDAARPTEAYVWGGLTSKALITGFWWLLLPFTLVNVAGWMAKDLETRWRRIAIRWLVMLSGVGQTIVYVAYIVVAVMDVTAVRCGADIGCVNRWYLTPLTWFQVDGIGHPVWRVAAGGTVVVFLIWLLFGVAARNRRLHETFDPQGHITGGEPEVTEAPLRTERSGNLTLAHPEMWFQSTDGIFRVHLLVATATVAFAVGTGLSPAVEGHGWLEGWQLVWLLFLAITCLAVVAYLAKPDRVIWDPRAEEYWPRPNKRVATVAWISSHLAAAGGAGLIGWWWRQSAPITDAFGEQGFMQVVVTAAKGYLVLMILLILLTIPDEGFRTKGRSIRHHWRRTDPTPDAVAEADLRQAGFRFLPVPAAVGLGLFMAFAGFSAVLVRLIAYLEGGNEARLGTGLIGGNSSYFGFSALVAMLFGAWWIGRGDSRSRVADAVMEAYRLHPSHSPRQTTWVKRVVNARRRSDAGRNVDLVLLVFILTFGLVLLILFIAGGEQNASTPMFGWGWLETGGSWVLLLFLFPGVFILRGALRARDTRRSVGKVWDVLTFWPRTYHPLAAPCYAERAVPELRDRIIEHTEGGGCVLLSAHSQGTVIAYAALQQVHARGGDHLERTALVTYGSPIRQLFVPFFPAYFNVLDLEQTAAELCPAAGWVNFYRDTDYIGKRVFFADGEPGDAPGVDVMLLDPEKPLLPPQLHSNYDNEPDLQAWIERARSAMPRVTSPGSG